MKRPGDRLRALAAYLCHARTMERFVDPTVADLQAEHEDAIRHGRRWDGARVWLVGHIAVIKVLALQGGRSAVDILRDRTADDRRAVLRTVVASAAMMFIGTLALTMPGFMNSVPKNHLNSVGWPFYLVELTVFFGPQVLPLSIPMGLMFGILWALGRMSASRRAKSLVLFLALGASLVSFAMGAWVVPTSNRAFRAFMTGRQEASGDLTMGELRERLKAETNQPRAISVAANPLNLSMSYHRRWALGSAPLALALFAVAFTSRRQWGRVMPLLVGGALIFAYYVVMFVAQAFALGGTMSPFAAAWTPNAIVLMLSLAIARFRARQANSSLG